MTLGLDGKLYFTHGDGCCSYEAKDGSHNARNFDVTDASGRHVSSSNLANTLRVNRDGTEFEILADRQRNNYETSLNAFGNAFTSDNDDDGNRGSRVIWVMDGGSYGYRTPGSPRHWGEEVPGNIPKLVGTGNGSPCGITVYEGALLGDKYKGCLFEADAGTRQINYFPIERHGSNFRTDYQVLLASSDNWFRPVDMTAAPDGSLYVADWYDGGVGGHNFQDQNTGRIYRVAPKGNKPSIAKPDFATIPGLIALLKSPVVASQDAARRLLIERGAESESRTAVAALFRHGTPIERGRALWVLSQIEGDTAAIRALRDADPQIREQGVRILGRDLSQVGNVVFTKPETRKPARGLLHVNALLPLVNDPDAGVRRELILAFRWLPTARVGDALKTLVKNWDGQDRWYLEALGLALQNRESSYLAEIFNDATFGPLDLEKSGQNGQVALPPYFPADRNEAYIATGTADLPATALSKSLGLAWRLHRPEALGLLKKVYPVLEATELQQAADDAILQIEDREAAILVADQALQSIDPSRKFALMATLGRKINGSWRDARSSAPVVKLIESTLADPTARIPAIALAVASGDGRYGSTLLGFAKDEKASESVRLAAVEAIGRIKPNGTVEFIKQLIDQAKKGGSTPVAEAAIRTLPDLRNADPELLAMIGGNDFPLGLRREALRVYARPRNGGARKVLELAREHKLPDELKSEAASIASNDADGRVRREAADLLPLPKTASGRTLPPIRELVARNGNPSKGITFFTRTADNACANCHRVQGIGQWVGPDLSTIGTKYGKEELLRSILYPSAAIGYNFKSNVLALSDGRVLTGLIVEEAPDRIVLKTADGKRHTINPKDVEDRKITEVSLMPEGLAEAMSDTDLVDLLAFLTTLKEPVSVVGQYQAVGPVAGDDLLTAKSALPGKLAWRRTTANAEGIVDLTTLAGEDASKAAYLMTPILVPEALNARLVLDAGPAKLKVWLDGQPLTIPAASGDQPRSVVIPLAKGNHELTIRVAGGAKAGLVTTFVAAKPLEFRVGEGTAVSER